MRVCGRCKAMVNTADKKCPYCHFVELSLIETIQEPDSVSPTAHPETQTQSSNPCWACSSCGYEYNLYEKCVKCKVKKDATDSSTAKNGRYLLPSGRLLWRCSQGHQFNLPSDAFCRDCEEPNGFKPGLEYTDSFIWTCFRCCSQSHGKSCLKCLCPRSWSGYLQSTANIRLNSSKSAWICDLCSTENTLFTFKCSHCKGKTVIEIKKWIEVEKTESWWCFCCNS